MAVRVRPLTVKDKPAVMDILRHTTEFKPIEVDTAEELIDAFLEKGLNSGYFTLVAEVDSKVLGYICYGPTPLTIGAWDVYWLAVSPEAQRRGVGQALLAAAESDIRQNHGRLILIETSGKADYYKAQGFYARMGYDMVSRIADFYEPGDDRLLYLKRLV